MMPDQLYVYIYGHNLKGNIYVANVIAKQKRLFRFQAILKQNLTKRLNYTLDGHSINVILTPDVKPENEREHHKNFIPLYVKSTRGNHLDDKKAIDRLKKQLRIPATSLIIETYNGDPDPDPDEHHDMRERIFQQIKAFLQKDVSVDGKTGKHYRRAHRRTHSELCRNEGLNGSCDGKRKGLDRSCSIEIPEKDNGNEDNGSAHKTLSEDPGEFEMRIFRETLRSGQAPSNYIPVIVVGNAQAGKTTLIRRLAAMSACQDIEFDVDPECSRVTTCCMEKNGKLDWETVSDFREDLNIQMMAQAMRNVIENIKLPDQVSKTEDEGKEYALGDDLEFGSAELEEETSSTDSNSISDSYANVLRKKKYIQRVVRKYNQDTDDTMYVSYLEYGGQSTVACINQQFLPPSAVYILVIDLSLDLDVKLTDSQRERQKNLRKSCCILKEYTLADTIRFWKSSILKYATDVEHMLAPLIVVGTRRNCLSDTEAEEKVELIKTIMEDDDINLFLIDNNSKNLSDLMDLRDQVLESGRRIMECRIPAQWIELEEELFQRELSGSLLVTFDDVVAIDRSSDVPMNDKARIENFLDFLHQRGLIIYFPRMALSANILMVPAVLFSFIKTLTKKVNISCKSGNVDKAVLSKVVDGLVREYNKKLDLDQLLQILVHLHVVINWQQSKETCGMFMPHLLQEKPENISDDAIEHAPTIEIQFEECHMHPALFYQFINSLLDYPKIRENSRRPQLFDMFARLYIYSNTTYLELMWKASSILISLKNFSHEHRLSNELCSDLFGQIKQRIEDNISKFRQDVIDYNLRVECPKSKSSYVALKELEESSEALCDMCPSHHSVTIAEALGIYMKPSDQKVPIHYSVREDVAKFLEKPTDLVLGRLANSLPRENLYAFARLLKRSRCLTEVDQLPKEFHQNLDLGRMELLHKWRLSKPQANVGDLVHLITKNKDYDRENIKRIICGKDLTENSSYDLKDSTLANVPSEKCLLKICSLIGKQYWLLLLELGMSWIDVQRQKDEDFQTNLLKHLLDWKLMNPKTATVRELLDCSFRSGLQTNSIVEYVRSFYEK